MKYNYNQPILNQRQWILIFILLLLLHILLIFTAIDQWFPMPQRQRLPISLYMMDHPIIGELINTLPWIQDPSIFAIPSDHGFTAKIWNSHPAPPAPFYQRLNLTDFRIKEFTYISSFTFEELINWTNMCNFEGLIATLSREPETSLSRFRKIELPLASYIELVGPIKDRGLLYVPEIPPQIKNLYLIPPITVDVLVDKFGLVLSAIIEPPGSGEPQLDAIAIETTLNLRFSPSSSSNLQPGKVIFHWYVQPLDKTQ